MRFENVNGDDILLYPGIAVIPRPDGAFALIDLRELQINAQHQGFHEEDGVPSDASIAGHTWAKQIKMAHQTDDLKITIKSQFAFMESYISSPKQALQKNTWYQMLMLL